MARFILEGNLKKGHKTYRKGEIVRFPFREGLALGLKIKKYKKIRKAPPGYGTQIPHRSASLFQMSHRRLRSLPAKDIKKRASSQFDLPITEVWSMRKRDVIKLIIKLRGSDHGLLRFR